MKLFTVQPQYVFEQIKAGVYQPDPGKVEFFTNDECGEKWKNAYNFVVKVMHERVPSYDGRLPIWFWPHSLLTSNYKHGKGPKKRLVIIEAEIPDERCLVIPFQGWHHCLNGWGFGREFDEQFLSFSLEDMKIQNDTYLRIESSWRRLLDEKVFRSEMHVDDSYDPSLDYEAQVVADTIHSHEIISALHFKGYGP